MFKRGGGVSSRNNGIVSGFDDGGRVGYTPGGAVDYLKNLGLFEQPTEPKGLTRSDFLRIAAAGAQIMGAPASGQTGLRGALTAAGPVLGNLGTDLASAYDARRANFLDAKNLRDERIMEGIIAGSDKDEFERVLDRADQLTDIIDNPDTKADEKRKAFANYTVLMLREIGVDLADYEVGGVRTKVLEDNPDATEDDILFEVLKLRLPELTTRLGRLREQIEEAEMRERQGIAEGGRVGMNMGGVGTDSQEQSKAELDRIARQEEISQKQDALLRMIDRQRAKRITNSNRVIEEIEKMGSVLSPSDKEFIMERNNAYNTFEGIIREDLGVMGRNPDGPRVGFFNEGGSTSADRADVREQSAAMQSQPALTFEELRARLPNEVTDAVVRLLASSEAALLDFAGIESEQDIAIFNQKYNSDLQLPTQVA